MGVTQIVALVVLGFFLVIVLVRVFAKPLGLALKLLFNTLLGFAALFLLNLAAPLTGLALGFNLWNALTVGILGVPGLFLLLLLKWIL